VQQVLSFRIGQKIALYLANDGEINPNPIQNFLKSEGIVVYLPILDDKSLKFEKLSNTFKKNKFGINEPISDTTTEALNAEQLDVIFVPLVGFDKHKNRIGMGGGFYARTLAFKKNQTKDSSPKLIGLAFDCQKVDKITVEAWDVPLNAVVTPTTTYR
jgi:5-formyltetrahydrofolate cyclo-ligase